MPNLKLLAQPLHKYYRGTPNVWGAPLAQGHTHFFFWSDLMMGLGKLQLHAKFEVAGFNYYGNIREFVFKRRICFLSHLLGRSCE